MKKIKLLLGIVLVLCFLAGCGKNNDTTDKTNDYSDASSAGKEEKIKNDTQETVSTYNIGDTVILGTFEQDDNEDNGAEPIEWIVLDTDENKALLLSKYVLTEEQYDYSGNQVTWYTSTLFQWLNSDFKNEAFTEDEKGQIINSEYGDVFLLSFDEAVKYFDISVMDTVWLKLMTC